MKVSLTTSCSCNPNSTALSCKFNILTRKEKRGIHRNTISKRFHDLRARCDPTINGFCGCLLMTHNGAAQPASGQKS